MRFSALVNVAGLTKEQKEVDRIIPYKEFKEKLGNGRADILRKEILRVSGWSPKIGKFLAENGAAWMGEDSETYTDAAYHFESILRKGCNDETSVDSLLQAYALKTDIREYLGFLKEIVKATGTIASENRKILAEKFDEYRKL